MKSVQHSVGDIDNLINLLQVASEDENIGTSLNRLLSQTDSMRQDAVRELLKYLCEKDAPQELKQAIAYLEDNEVAAKAREFIRQRC